MENWIHNNIGKFMVMLMAGIFTLSYLGDMIPMDSDKYKYRVISDNGCSYTNSIEATNGCIKTFNGTMCGTYKIIQNRRYHKTSKR